MGRAYVAIGILTYDLQPFTEDFLFRLSRAIEDVALCAYPVYYHPFQDKARIPHLPSTLKGKYLGVTVSGSTPEGFASNTNWRAAWECVRRSDLVVLFGLQGPTALVTGLLGSSMRRCLISVNQTLPPQWERKRRWWVRLLKQWLLGRCDYHVYQSPASRDVLTDVYGLPQDRLFFSPFEGGASSFKRLLRARQADHTRIRRDLGLGNEVVFLFVGNLHPFKGVPLLIRALARMPGDSDFTCVLIGPEEPRNGVGGTIGYYMDLARNLRVETRLRFLAELPKEGLADYYSASDVVVLPTRKDCFPKVLVEAAVASKPLITTSACGSAGLIVVDGDNGFVVGPDDADGLATAMTKLMDPGLRERMGKRSREIVDLCCDDKTETDTFADAIRRAMEGWRFRGRLDPA